MKRKVTMLFLLAVGILGILILSGCEYTNKQVPCVAENYINGYHNMYYEWVSPDGVHYWIMTCGNRAGLAPRYDRDGRIVVDEVGK